MSADFWSFAAVMPIEQARALAAVLAVCETCSPIKSLKGDVLHDFDRQGPVVDLRAVLVGAVVP